MADYSTAITVGSTHSALVNTGNPPWKWNPDPSYKQYELQYTDARLQVGSSSAHSVALTGLRVLGSTVTGAVGEMAVDKIEVHVLNTIGTIVEFWYLDEVVGSATLVNGVNVLGEYIPAAKMLVPLTLTWSPLP